jgi:flagellar hook-basal body complex protein FliE
MINKLNGLNSQILPKQGVKIEKKEKEQNGDFLSTLNGFMSEVNQLQKEAGESVNRIASGDITNIHDVMVAVEKANVSFELMMEIRNKVIEAYREVMRTQL